MEQVKRILIHAAKKLLRISFTSHQLAPAPAST
jgi:hypothetical protein